MGNCCTGGESHQDRQPINDERTGLLGPRPVTSAPIDTTTDYGAATNTPSISKNDEQAQLSRILQDTADNVIDVSAVEPHSMGEQEYRDRQRHYSNRRLAASTSNHGPRSTARTDFPPGQTAPVEVLSAPPVSVSDVRFMHGLTSAVSDALGSVAVKSTEPIVVQF
ncbi:ragulator complex protein LAMTOR1-like [Sycon ciliatum]|uniref:ragulator complex protein LAMTOR1-like n=1 Tax=Sycon ciliatum TaxID=27933 RepID=UPI0020ACCAA4|eukprot:scpid85834/ scgid24744/ Ragulator complex protein LAMTOR1; Late endosomal/lysosomal adaptor and MAPK and MTOR activator 1; Lipid raft adaptor protein p18